MGMMCACLRVCVILVPSYSRMCTHTEQPPVMVILFVCVHDRLRERARSFFCWLGMRGGHDDSFICYLARDVCAFVRFFYCTDAGRNRNIISLSSAAAASSTSMGNDAACAHTTHRRKRIM